MAAGVCVSSVVCVPDRVLDLVLLPSVAAVSDQYFPLSPVSSIPLSSTEPVAAVAYKDRILDQIWANLPKKSFFELVNLGEIYLKYLLNLAKGASIKYVRKNLGIFDPLPPSVGVCTIWRDPPSMRTYFLSVWPPPSSLGSCYEPRQ